MGPKLCLEVADLSYRYPTGTMALDRVSFSIEEGERVALIGPNGAGKTSLFLSLSGVIPAKAENLQVAGLDVLDATQRKQLASRVGIVFQDSDDQLFSATLADDVAFGPLNLGLDAVEVRRRVAESLERVGLSGMGERVPFHLSGGEKRRAALAGVLAMQPQVLLLDEPSMFLDPRGRRELIALLNGLEGTRLIASHDLELVLETCGRALLLDGGRLIADGPTSKLLADQELMEAHGLEVPHSLRDPSRVNASKST